MTTYQFGNTPILVDEGQTVRFRFKAPTAWDSSQNVTVQIGQMSTVWVITTIPQDFAPDTFAFTTLDNGGVGGTAWSTAGGNAEPGCIGVFNGAFFIDSTGKPTFANNVVASQATSKDYNTGSNDIIAFVNDNPMQEYVVKADAQVTQAMIGAQNAMNMNNYTATDNKDGQSISTLDVASASTTAQFRLVRSAEDPENKDLTVAGANIIVSFLPSSMLY